MRDKGLTPSTRFDRWTDQQAALDLLDLKQLLDRVIHAYGLKGELEYTLFRPFNWIGAGLDSLTASNPAAPGVITQFIGHIIRGEPIQLVDGGSARRSFTDGRRHRRADDHHREPARCRHRQDLQHR